ncbi:transposase [Pseudonocardia sp. HH130629-09]|nr:transposase [Pseudonocardia sp. HH130629-09]ALE82823.1 transposase [Pseudonocardia sp. HH130629-09]
MQVEEDLEAWAGGLDGLFGLVAGRFFRTEPRRRARAYVRGLLAPLAGKNGWTLAEVAGDTTPDGMQRLLNSAAWDADGVRDDLRDYVTEHLGEPGGVLIVDETGFLKKGAKSAGVQRQYSGTAGRVENCQLGVFCAYASGRGRTLIDRELYLPRSWTGDRERCRAAAVPDEVEFATKTVLAKQMLGRALDAGVPASWVAADEAYGQDYKFRSWCEKRRIGYVVAVPRSQSIPLSLEADIAGLAGSRRADDLVARAPEQAWKRRSAGDGAKGERLYDWAVASLSPPPEAPAGWGRWLLVRRQILTDTQIAAGDEPELAYYLCAGPPGTSDDDLIRVAGARWAIEECFQTAKNEVGLDQYQVRRYDAWYRHITLAMLAHAYLSVTAAIAPKDLAAGSSRSPSPRSDVSWHL